MSSVPLKYMYFTRSCKFTAILADYIFLTYGPPNEYALKYGLVPYFEEYDFANLQQ